MIYTIGYAGGLTPSKLQRIVMHLDAELIDCRSRPTSRIAGFGGNQLDALLNAAYIAGRDRPRYAKHGAWLGGRGNVKAGGIEFLRGYDGADRKNAILMCMEEEPWLCHRHADIVKPHFPDALHIYSGLLYSPADIDQAIETRQMPPSRGELFPSK